MPHHSAPRLGSVCPHSGIAPWARREGPSMVQRGYPGIHAGMPTTQCLRSASVVNGAPRSTSTPPRGGLTAGLVLPGGTPIRFCGSKACSRGGLTADLSLRSCLHQAWFDRGGLCPPAGAKVQMAETQKPAFAGFCEVQGRDLEA